MGKQCDNDAKNLTGFNPDAATIALSTQAQSNKKMRAMAPDRSDCA